MENLLIVSLAYNEVFTDCGKGEVESSIKRAREHYTKDLALVTNHKTDFPKDAEYWQGQIDRYTRILQAGFEAITFDEYMKREKEIWLNRPIKEVDGKEFEDMLNVLPPLNWIRNERYSMFMVGECTTMTYYAQYLYDREKKKYYTALADSFDDSTWLDKRLGLI